MSRTQTQPQPGQSSRARAAAGCVHGAGCSIRTVLLIGPTTWDATELPRLVTHLGYHIVSAGSDVSEHPESFDALAFIDRAVMEYSGRGLDGVIASDDYPGSLVGAAIAEELGLPGPSMRAVLQCQHKYYARVSQRVAVPEATPRFWLIDPTASPETVSALPYPFFVKPVKSYFSLLADRVDGPADLTRVVQASEHHRRHFVKPFDQLMNRYTALPLGGGHLLAEDLLDGAHVTVEGYVITDLATSRPRL